MASLREFVGNTVRSAFRAFRGTPTHSTPTRRSPSATSSAGQVAARELAYPGDFTGTGVIRYAPKPDGLPDPGEIVWTWVPFEEDYSQGKDRPVLLIGRDKQWLLAVMLTSKDHRDDHRGDNDYLDLGSGPWDKAGRPSEAKLDRVIRVDPKAIRREGAVLDSIRFGKVAAALQTRHGWRAA